MRWLARGWVIGAALCALALAVAFRLGTADTWWIELLRYVPFLAWLLPALAALALSWVLTPWWRVVALLTVALVVTQVMGLSLGLSRDPGGPQPAATVPRQALRLMTYNIKSYRAEWQWGAYEAIADEIARQAPDVLVLQDALYLNRPEGMHEALRDALAGYQRYGADQYVVASRWPLRDCHLADMPIGDEPHAYLRCTVVVGATSLTLITAHTLTPREGLNATRHDNVAGLDDWQQNFAGRMAQARRLAADLANAPRPLVLAGDLNAPEHSPVVQALLGIGLRDAFSAAGRGWGYSVGHALKPHVSFLRIDHILLSPDIGVSRAVVGSRSGSEHRPVVADMWVAQ
jgi:endonuclease/exonuclease/phosphatase (EEP) superfamily protein YafD